MSISTTELTVQDVLLAPEKIPVLAPSTFLKQALEEMNKYRLGVVCVVDDDGRLIGIFTDGDIRRLLLKSQKPFAALFVDDIIVHASPAPTTVPAEMPLRDALVVMEDQEIWDLPVINSDSGVLLGLLHLHPAIKAVMGI